MLALCGGRGGLPPRLAAQPRQRGGRGDPARRHYSFDVKGYHLIVLDANHPAATHWEGSYATVTLSDQRHIQGHGKQRSYTLRPPRR